MSTFTSQDVYSKANQYGITSFSDADKKLIDSNPDAGMTLVNYMNDWKTAGTDEAKTLAHNGAESVRNQYGYSGGSDGSGFYVVTPTGYTPKTAEEYSGYTWEKPVYADTYGDTVKAASDKVLNYGDFEYDAATDPLYAQVRKQYTREGQRAAADTMGSLSAATGGIPSSYAATAASQQRNYYAGQMTDKIPELYQQAYNKYLNQFSQEQAKLSAAQSLQQNEQNMYLNELNQYDTDRNFDYTRYLNSVNQLNTENDAALQALQYQQNLRQQDYENRLTEAQLAANTGNYKPLADLLGMDQSELTYNQRLELAQLAASAGDYSLLNAMTGGNAGTNNGGSGYVTDNGDTDTTEEQTVDPGATDNQLTQAQLIDALNYYTAQQQNEEKEKNSTTYDSQVQTALDRADANGGVIQNAADWSLLVNAIGFDALTKEYGYKYRTVDRRS